MSNILSRIAASLKASGVQMSGVEGSCRLQIDVNGKHKVQTFEFKQQAKHEDWCGKYVNRAFSHRPIALADGQLVSGSRRRLEDNTERARDNGITEKKGLSLWVPYPYKPNKFKTTTIMTCGCMGANTSPEQREIAMRDGYFSRLLFQEAMIRGTHREQIIDGRIYKRESSGYAMGSNIYNPNETVQLSERIEKIDSHTEKSKTTISQRSQTYTSTSISHKHGNKTLTITDSTYRGKHKCLHTHEEREVINIDAQHAIAITRYIETNSKGKVSANTRVAKATEINRVHRENIEIDGFNPKGKVKIRGISESRILG